MTSQQYMLNWNHCTIAHLHSWLCKCAKNIGRVCFMCVCMIVQCVNKRESILYIYAMCVHVYMYVCTCMCGWVWVWVCEGCIRIMHSQEWYNVCVQAYCSFCPHCTLICLELVKCSAVPLATLAPALPMARSPKTGKASKIQCSRPTEQCMLTVTTAGQCTVSCCYLFSLGKS